MTRSVATPADLMKALEARALRGVDAAVRDMRDHAVAISPEDTGEFVRNHVAEPAQMEGYRAVGRLVNETPHGPYLEYGVRGAEFNYHKGPRRAKFRRVIYRGFGVRVYARTVDALRGSAMATIKKTLYGR